MSPVLDAMITGLALTAVPMFPSIRHGRHHPRLGTAVAVHYPKGPTASHAKRVQPSDHPTPADKSSSAQGDAVAQPAHGSMPQEFCAALSALYSTNFTPVRLLKPSRRP